MDIDKILLKVLNNSANKEEYELLEAWKKESEEHIRLLQDMASGETLDMDSYKSFDAEKAWSGIEDKVDSQDTSSPSGTWMRWAIAALLLTISAAGIYLYINREVDPQKYESTDTVQHQILADNTEIWLNKGGTRVELLSDFDKTREVALSGEAYFDVTPDKEKPFTIQLKDGNSIKVIGTSFNVISTDDKFDLTVYSGVVEFHALDRTIVLEAEDRITFLNGAYAKLKNNEVNKLSWKNKELIFENTPLNNVFEAIERHYSVSIDYNKKQDLSGCTLRTRFEDESLESVLQELVKHFGFKFSTDKETIKISGIHCE